MKFFTTRLFYLSSYLAPNPDSPVFPALQIFGMLELVADDPHPNACASRIKLWLAFQVRIKALLRGAPLASPALRCLLAVSARMSHH